MAMYNSMKDIACDLEDIADVAEVEYDFLAALVEFMVKIGHMSYEDAIERLTEELMIEA